MDYTWKRVIADEAVSNTPGFIGSVILTCDGAGNADATIHDGESTSDPVILTIKALQHSTKIIRFQPPLQTQRGLYVDIGTNVTEVIIQHHVNRE